MKHENNDPLSVERDLRKACADVSVLVSQGHSTAALTVLDNYPQLACCEESAIEIIYAEFMALDERARRPDVEQWLNYFPDYRQRLERLLKLHDFLSEDEVQQASRETMKVATNAGHESQPVELPEPSTATTPLNRRIGSYELIEEVGRGGMGIVYRARQVGLARTVALKVLRALDARPDQRARFQREAEAIASMHHSNIVQVYEVGNDGDDEFLSMEFVEGGALDRHIYDRPWSNHEIATLVKTLADTMHYAHQLGIIHRDLKPANVLLSANGTPKIVDFGLAKRFHDSSNFRTNTGTLIGTPCYMSPEQAAGAGKSIGPTTDVFSLGVVLYELLTRELPFMGSTTVETLQLIAQREPILPSKLNRHVPRDLETICLKCMAKLPAQRYKTAAELSADLGCFLDHRPIQARRTTIIERLQRVVARHPQLTALMVVMSLVGLGVTSIIAWQQRRMASISHQAQLQAQSAQQQRNRATEAEAAYDASLRRARELVGRWTQLGLTLDNEPGMDSVRRKAFEDAVAYYQEFLKTDQADPAIRQEAAQASLRAAVIHIELGLWKEAEEGLRRSDSWLSEMTPSRDVMWQRTDCLIQLGHVLRRLERWGDSEETYLQAISILEELIEQSPTNTSYLMRVANAKVNICVVYGTQQRWDECITNYVDALNIDLRAAEIRAGILTASEQKPDDSDDLDSRVASEIQRSRSLREKLLANDKPKLVALAVENYLPEIGLCLDDLGAVLERTSHLNAAEACFREAVQQRQLTVELAPKHRRIEQYLARSETHLGSVLLETDRVQEAIDVLQRASSIFSKLARDFPDRHDYKSEWSSCLVQLARGQMLQRELAESIKSATQAVSIQEQLVASAPAIGYMKDSLAEGLLALARSLQESGELEQAADQYQRAMDVTPTNAHPANNYAWMLANYHQATSDDHRKAVELAEKATTLESKNANYWNTLALALYRVRRYSEASIAIERSMELASGGSTFDWFIKSLVLSQLGKVDEARQWFHQAETRRQAQSPRSSSLRAFSEEANRSLSDKSL